MIQISFIFQVTISDPVVVQLFAGELQTDIWQVESRADAEQLIKEQVIKKAIQPGNWDVMYSQPSQKQDFFTKHFSKFFNK